MRKINYKTYRIYKLLSVIIIAAIVSSFITLGNYIVPLIIIVLFSLILFFLKRKVNVKLRDERIDYIAGKASRIVLVFSNLIIAIAGIVLIALREKYPEYFLLGNVLAYLACGMLIFYSILFRYYSNKKI